MLADPDQESRRAYRSVPVSELSASEWGRVVPESPESEQVSDNLESGAAVEERYCILHLRSLLAAAERPCNHCPRSQWAAAVEAVSAESARNSYNHAAARGHRESVVLRASR